MRSGAFSRGFLEAHNLASAWPEQVDSDVRHKHVEIRYSNAGSFDFKHFKTNSRLTKFNLGHFLNVRDEQL